MEKKKNFFLSARKIEKNERERDCDCHIYIKAEGMPLLRYLYILVFLLIIF